MKRVLVVLTAVMIVLAFCDVAAFAFSAKIPPKVRRVIEEGPDKNTDEVGRPPKEFYESPTETPAPGEEASPGESPGETPESGGTGSPGELVPPAHTPEAPGQPAESPGVDTPSPTVTETPAPKKSNARLFFTIVLVTLLILAGVGAYLRKKGHI